MTLTFYFGLLFENITFSRIFQQWVPEFSYFTLAFLVKRYFYSYRNIFGIAFFWRGGEGAFVFHKHILFFFFRNLKGKNKAIMGPLLPLTFILGYQYDLAYGSKMDRMRGKLKVIAWRSYKNSLVFRSHEARSFRGHIAMGWHPSLCVILPRLRSAEH